ncbi:MAG TPA: NAD(P)-dependent oxidoreductase [Devosiaceae bacterium]|jgi:D-3-phosphoglycerate dehydrogenase|nr:NAD(P)-dependent oxidoreductase [Devosiaceae bacterium]
MTTVIYLGATEGFEAASATLAGVAEVTHVPAEPGAVASAMSVADALLDASMKVPLSETMLEAASGLRIISCATTGSDHIARVGLDRRGVPVRTLREDPDLLRNITPAAELSWALLMACARRLPAAVAHVSAGGWTREAFPGTMLNGKRLGLVGCGRIGGWMARYGAAFGMDVIGYDPHLQTFPDSIRRVPLAQVFAEADFVSVHVHLSPETSGLVSAELIAGMKRGAVLINTSRGAIVDETALAEALRSRHLGGAGLDVLDGEPETAEHPLVKLGRTHDNVLITPHCGGFSPDAVRIVCARAAEKIRDVLEEREA